MFFYELFKYFYYHCTYNCMRNTDLLCWLRKKIIFSFHSPIFHSKIHTLWVFFWEGEGCNSLSKCALRVGSTFKTNRVKEVGQGEGGVKYWKFCANMLFVSLGPDPLPANHNPTIFFDLPGFKKLSCPRQTFCTFLTMTLLIISE